MEDFGKIEDHVRREALQLFDDGGHIVEDRQRFHIVSQALQAGEHVGFGGLVSSSLSSCGENVSAADGA